ncbi:hypothetical protein [Segniliparus rugosus]|uniref:Orn/DAP/Arg decarboxylase 2 N-terminal domain-containing protein n=1 Tax=Segniliparus rugosus (strain ATCC BAA-974 / DSM 45345 / CCUG 50838 / CIP 108380 / JCM 13579 / CDC 945) TaxID=679197 RepID=U1LMH3_SEGRC|nr:hypothetical protein [Segniliparus rugosus]ERG69146.1 hypothetical protein HMPREF9336_04290 [Segniliparus rugosus ATCC BAA-974]
MGVSLPAVWPDWAEALIAHPTLLQQIADGAGGAFHVVHPPTFARNLADFQAVFTEFEIEGLVYFAKKANKSTAWLRAVAEAGAGVDVASLGEFRSALGHGVRGEKLVVTGPAKSDELLWLAVRHGALIAVDELSELERAIAFGSQEQPVRVLLRAVAAEQPDTRFGMSGPERKAAVHRCADAGAAVRMEGFSLHLSGYDPLARAVKAGRLAVEIGQARALGLPADTISIGGGFAVDYVRQEDWEAFQAETGPSQFHAKKEFPGGFYPYHSPVSGAGALAEVLTSRYGSEGPDLREATIAEALRAKGIKLAVEPGRALLADAGVSVFEVQGFKWREHLQYGIATVAGTSLSLSEQWFASEFLPEPRLWPEGGAQQRTPSAVGGTSCLDSDMLTWRKLPLPRPPKRGDFLVYPNTAGYQMDSNESAFHELPIPKKVVLDLTGPEPRWFFEEAAWKACG